MEYQGFCERIILKCVLKIGWEGVDWIHLAEDVYQWRAFVSEVMNVFVYFLII
jgi:hypothetical protein